VTRVHANILPWLLLHQYLESLRNRPEPQWLAQSDTLTFSSGCQNLTKYEYDPYGNTIVKTGALADANPFRFSTKYYDNEMGLIYFGYRFYSANLSRWISRDPIADDETRGTETIDEDSDGQNIYAFVDNDANDDVDSLGLKKKKQTPQPACKCGVKPDGFKMLNKGWTITATEYAFHFEVTIKMKTGKGYKPACCQYIQWIKSTMKLNGKKIEESAGHTPLDNTFHIDSLNWTSDTDTKNDWTDLNLSTSPDVFKANDAPGWGHFSPCDDILDDNVFKGTVVDICKKPVSVQNVVVQQQFKMVVKGKWPKVSYTPTP